jgi:PKD domain
MNARTLARLLTGCAVAVFLASGYAIVQAQTPNVPQSNCGNENQPPCGISVLNAVCDTGLARSAPYTCGCLLSGPFGGCLIPQLCTKCQNFLRRRGGDINHFKDSWTDWALRNQRRLAQDEPINWVMHVGSHNSFNTTADGHTAAPNQVFSMTDQLRAGARVLSLDLFSFFGAIRLCHGGNNSLANVACFLPGNDDIYAFPPGMRYYSQGIREIRNWMLSNPGEIIQISLENWAQASGGGATFQDVEDVFAAYFGAWTLKSPRTSPPGFTDVRWPTRREMLAAGRRVIILDDGSPQLLEDADIDVADRNEYVFRQQLVFGGFSEDWFAKNLLRYPNCPTQHVLQTSPVMSTITVEDRELALNVGRLDAADVADAAECNYSAIVLDKFSSRLPPIALDLFDDSRQAAAMWSWRVDDRGQHGQCALLDGSSGRWASANCNTARRFACAQPRSEAGIDPLQYTDRLGEDWKITTATGPWSGGQAACEAEYPGYNFSVPVNGYMNRKLRDGNSSASNLWLNYSQTQVQGQWEIGRLPAVAAPPIADAGPDQVIECGNTVTLDGSASKDPQGDPLTFTWSGPFGTLTGAAVTATLLAGEHAITLTVNDGNGGIDTDTVTVTVNDTTPPTMTLALSPTVLWPPNHKPVSVIADIEVHDTCDAEPPFVELVSVVSSQGANGRGDGNTSTDIVNADIGTDDRELELRAERSGGASERIYTATYRATDLAGNQTEASAQVVAPHDRGQKQ